MHSIRKCSVLILLAAILLTSCVTTVGRIKKKPKRYHGKRVLVYGRVVSALDLSDIECFTIKFMKSNILVVTPNYLPLKRDRVIVRGIVDAKYSYNKSILLVIKEKKKRSKKVKIPRVKEGGLIK